MQESYRSSFSTLPSRQIRERVKLEVNLINFGLCGYHQSDPFPLQHYHLARGAPLQGGCEHSWEKAVSEVFLQEPLTTTARRRGSLSERFVDERGISFDQNEGGGEENLPYTRSLHLRRLKGACSESSEDSRSLFTSDDRGECLKNPGTGPHLVRSKRSRVVMGSRSVGRDRRSSPLLERGKSAQGQKPFQRHQAPSSAFSSRKGLHEQCTHLKSIRGDKRMSFTTCKVMWSPLTPSVWQKCDTIVQLGAVAF